MIGGSLAKMISYHRTKLAQCSKPDVLRKSVNRRLRNLAIARYHSGTFEYNHFRPFYNLPRDLFETVWKDDLPFGDQVLQFLQCRGRTMVSIL
ncbi:hypothetical protein CUJ84_pRLN1000864 (plasmid) [Rhizobium leguminosarum]|uniref:Uncharacterized protein n=1 Tax=Rhizobium leguminosarum TaxID=384 RepID=A0A2K9ZDL6_RHILE|nr:hypothetical protein CUJ84_pRLN1000864 [Rhizobium leguminosarum]